MTGSEGPESAPGSSAPTADPAGASPITSVLLEVSLPTPADTDAFGRRLGQRLRAGDVVVLAGALGAGKTALVKGIGAGMGVLGTVMSPTFVIARRHPPGRPGGVPLVHVDAYRLTGAVELDDLDLDTDLGTAAVVVEWGDGLAPRLAPAYLRIELTRQPDDRRTGELTAIGPGWADRLAGLLPED